MASFSSSSFSTDAFSVLAFDFGGVSETVVSKGGIDERDYKRYRKHLERLEQITRQKDLTPAIIEAAQEIAEIPVETPELAKIAAQTTVEIDYSMIAAELSAMAAYLDKMLAYNIEIDRIMRERDDELAILLLMQ
jgi:hypothetical protein